MMVVAAHVVFALKTGQFVTKMGPVKGRAIPNVVIVSAATMAVVVLVVRVLRLPQTAIR